MTSPIRPPFTQETARAKVQAAEDAWNTRDPEVVARAYTEDSQWRNRDEFFTGREAIKEALKRKCAKELDLQPCASSTSGMMTRISGTEHTATSTGSSTRKVSCAGGT